MFSTQYRTVCNMAHNKGSKTGLLLKLGYKVLKYTYLSIISDVILANCPFSIKGIFHDFTLIALPRDPQ